MKYKFSKLIFRSNLVLCLLLIGIVISTQGTDVITKRTETISCPAEALIDCVWMFKNGSEIKIPINQSITINEFDKTYLNLANYGVWVLILFSFALNHFMFNRDYPVKKRLKKLF